MSHLGEKTNTHEEIDHDLDHPDKHTDVKIASGDEAFQQAMIKEPPPFLQTPLVIFASAIAFCCSTANGYDGSLFGTLLAQDQFKDFFSISNVGAETGVITAMYQIGQVCSLPFTGPAIDTWGRRWGMWIGAFIIVIGVIIQLTTVTNHHLGQFMAGRFFLGFGVGIVGAAGPVYVVEISHPAWRGVVGGLYNVMWPVGALVASGAARGGLEHTGNSSWLIPVGLQMMFPMVIVLGALFVPESPRWLYTRGRQEEATKMLTSLHGRQKGADSEWVKLQLHEYEQFLEMDGTDKTWWNYSALFRNRASIYRLMCNCIVSLFGQWAGNSIVSYYLSGFLDTAGIHGATLQTDIAMGMNGIQIAFAAVGAALVDRVGRRPMLVIVNLVCGLCWIGVIVPCSIGNITDPEDEAQRDAVPPPVSRAVLAWVYIFQICYSVGWTPLQALYPVEVLSFEMRAKGMAFSSLFTSIALLATQFGVPVALKNIAWKTYIVFCVWCFVQSTVLYFLVPETKNRTLEELDQIFSSPHPVKESKLKKKLEVDAAHNIVHVDPVGKETSQV